MVSSQVGNVVGGLSKTADAGQVMREKRTLFFFKSKTPVALWTSRLTQTLNRCDVIGTSRFTGKNIVASEGIMFNVNRQTWHRGTTVIRMPDGERTLTHLQSLSLPSSSYYFDRPLANEQAVGLATGQMKSADVAGFVGQVSQTEALCPSWAGTKRSLILARLHWGRMKDEG